MSWRRRLEEGQASEAVLILPVVLGVVFLILQIGIWAHARDIAVHSAREGAVAAASHHSTQSADGVARTYLERNAGGVLRSYSVTSAQSADTVTVTVHGQALSLVPFVQLPPVTQTVSVPIEKYVP